MKEYTALHFVKIGKELKTPGEVFLADLSEEKEARLLRKGAIIAQQQAVTSAPEQEESVETDAETETEETAAEDLAVEEAAPEIDVMAGIGTPKKPTRRKSK